MSKFEIRDLPQIVHQLQVIILASAIEAKHKSTYNQDMQPDNARVLAMQYNAFPNSQAEGRMATDAYRTAIRIWKAAKALGITWNDNRRMDANDLIMAGL
jgi:hypothetical protein